MCNAAGGKEEAVVIWKSEKPRCFKGINVSQLPVKYFNQQKAWEILHTILTRMTAYCQKPIHLTSNGQRRVPSSRFEV